MTILKEQSWKSPKEMESSGRSPSSPFRKKLKKEPNNMFQSAYYSLDLSQNIQTVIAK